MSLTATQRAALTHATRPPGPPAFWYALGTAVRAIGSAMDKLGLGIMDSCGTNERLPIPTTGVKLNGKAPAYADAAFVAPSANLVGAVNLGSGASVWYSSMVTGGKAACDIGDMSNVGDRSVIVDSIVGKNVCIGAGAIVKSATIGDNSSVGMGCIMNGGSMGSQSILVAGSVLPAGTTIPSGEVWGGNPATKVGKVADDDINGILAVADMTHELAKLHADEAWKDLTLIEQEKGDYKRQSFRTPDFISFLRRDPGWVPLPTLGGQLSKMDIHSQSYLIK